jgi:homoserine kinase
MPVNQFVRVRVPATTANLGPGFDCLGLSLDLWNEVEISFQGNSVQIEIEGEGKEFLPTDGFNLVFQSLKELAFAHRIELPAGIHIRCLNRIPVSSGLGSSSSAIIAGLVGGSKILGISPTMEQILELGCGLEGHVDNLAACLVGGLTIAITQNRAVIVNRMEITQFHAVIALPEVAFSTREARQALPKTIPFADAVFNLSRTALLISALSQANFYLLGVAMEDRLHQPYRYGLIPGAAEVQAAALQAGALGAALSGAGPSVIAFLRENDGGKVADSMRQTFSDQGVKARVFHTQTSNLGAQVL